MSLSEIGIYMHTVTPPVTPPATFLAAGGTAYAVWKDNKISWIFCAMLWNFVSVLYSVSSFLVKFNG